MGSVSAQVYPRGAGLPKCNAVVVVNGFGFFTLLRSVQNDRGGIDPRVKHGNDGGKVSAQVYPRGAGLPKCNAVVAVNGFGFFTLLRSVQNDRGGIDPRIKHGNDGGKVSAQVYPRGAGLPKCNAVVAVNGFGFFTLLRSVQNDRGGIDPRVKHGNDGGRQYGVSPALRGMPVCLSSTTALWYLNPCPVNDIIRRGRTPWQIRKTV